MKALTIIEIARNRAIRRALSAIPRGTGTGLKSMPCNVCEKSRCGGHKPA